VYGLKCPRCGSPSTEVVKTWQLVSPIPDKQGRITVTIMGVVKCLECGYQWRGVINKLKISTTSVSIGDREVQFEEEERKPKVITIDIDDILKEVEEEE